MTTYHNPTAILKEGKVRFNAYTGIGDIHEHKKIDVEFKDQKRIRKLLDKIFPVKQYGVPLALDSIVHRIEVVEIYIFNEGTYYNSCALCKEQFIGAKRQPVCKKCCKSNVVAIIKPEVNESQGEWDNWVEVIAITFKMRDVGIETVVTLQKFTNLMSLMAYFKDEKICKDYLETIRWNGQLKCAYADCGHDKVYKCKERYKCAKCERIYSVRVGTIFEDSKIPLQKWFAAIYLITSHKKGISSLQLHRDLGVTQKTAWFLLHRVRTSLGLNTGTEKLDGICEADETFMGGQEKNKHKSKRTEGTQGRSVKTKSPIAGIIKRGGELRAKMVPDTTGFNLKSYICKNIVFGSTIHTDEWWGYNGLAAAFKHGVVKHNEGEYVSGNSHTNTLEGFWSLLKRGTVGIYHSMSNKHLQKYIDEFVFRYNSRNFSEADRFDLMLNNIATHLTYEQLITSRGNRKMENKQGTIGI